MPLPLILAASVVLQGASPTLALCRSDLSRRIVGWFDRYLAP
ncbi:hypothetical protein [Caulobacter sp. X]|nr:hypothetical protein [Caulobacter sp. X]